MILQKNARLRGRKTLDASLGEYGTLCVASFLTEAELLLGKMEG